MKARLISVAQEAMMIPSISMCGLFCISSRSLKVPGSDSSALQTRYLSMSPVGQEGRLLAHPEAGAAAAAQAGVARCSRGPPRGGIASALRSD